MVNENLSFNVGSDIKLNEVRFIVDGYIVFEDSDGNRWTEYKIKSNMHSEVKWLSVDTLNDEYIIYTEKIYSEEFLEENIIESGYEKIDWGLAKVVERRGNVDVDISERVSYEEYENEAEELLISVENWDDESEFSKGYYINKNNIEIVECDSDNRNDSVKSSKGKGIVIAIASLILILIVVGAIFDNNNPDKSLSTKIGLIGSFQYETSITSDLDKDIKANVYSSNGTIEETAKLIIDEMRGNIEDVQENEEDGAVAILTKDEMAIVYKGEDSKTFIQVSLREYVYSSRNTLYMGNSISNDYYISYYYNRGYMKDKSRYSNASSIYNNYNNASPIQNNNSKYKAYSDSIRQSSVNTRSSSGDGISSGK